MSKYIFINCKYEIPYSKLLKYIDEETIKALIEKYKVIKVGYKGYKSIIYPICKYNDVLVVPRFMFSEIIDTLKLRECGYEDIWVVKDVGRLSDDTFALVAGFELKDYQKDLVRHIIDKLKVCGGKFGGIIKLEAGFGKTIIGLYLIRIIKRRCLVIVPTKLIYSGWLENMNKIYANSMENIVDIMIINSALKLRNEDLMNYGLVLYDETSCYCSDVRSEFLKRISHNVPFIFGLTAEVDSRIDLQDIYARMYIGAPISIQIDADEIVFPKSNVYILNYSGPPEYTKRYIKDFNIEYYKYVNQLIEDPYRNQIIMNIIKKYIGTGRNLFVFVDRVRHGNILLSLVRNILDFTNIGIITGEICENDREKIIKECSIIILTYSCGYRGLNIPRFDTLIMASPRKSYTYQIVKRIFRYMGSENERHIYDLVDVKSIVYKQAKERLKIYECADLNLSVYSNMLNYADYENEMIEKIKMVTMKEDCDDE